jgi:hypothetical protein
MRWAGHAERIEDRTDAYRVLAGISDRKRPLRRLRGRWIGVIKMNLQEQR